MPRKDEDPTKPAQVHDSVTDAVIERFMQQPPPKPGRRPGEHKGPSKTMGVPDAPLPVAHEVPDIVSLDESTMLVGHNAANAWRSCMFPDEPCPAAAQVHGLCRKHYNTLVSRKAAQRRKERKL